MAHLSQMQKYVNSHRLKRKLETRDSAKSSKSPPSVLDLAKVLWKRKPKNLYFVEIHLRHQLLHEVCLD